MQIMEAPQHKLPLNVWLIYQQEKHVSPSQKSNEHTWYTQQRLMYFSNEYSKHAPNMQNIYMKLEMIRTSFCLTQAKKNVSFNSYLCVVCISQPMRKITNINQYFNTSYYISRVDSKLSFNWWINSNSYIMLKYCYCESLSR